VVIEFGGQGVDIYLDFWGIGKILMSTPGIWCKNGIKTSTVSNSTKLEDFSLDSTQKVPIPCKWPPQNSKWNWKQSRKNCLQSFLLKPPKLNSFFLPSSFLSLLWSLLSNYIEEKLTNNNNLRKKRRQTSS